ncbi:MAG: hypothetical protein J2P17_30905, partial [Mycobacterium sp.]|nr:hypothetical protein [Mycobacterium sp.]
DLAALHMGDKVKGMVPYYIHATIKNTGPTDLSFTSDSHVKGLLTTGPINPRTRNQTGKENHARRETRQHRRRRLSQG